MQTIAIIIKWFLERHKYDATKDNIAIMIDQHLGQSTGRDDGQVIRHERGGYRYYIIRSLARSRSKP